MPLAETLRKLRTDKGMSMESVAAKAGISKTYLWELERDTEGAKRPSADILLRIANALSVTLAHLLSIPEVRVSEGRPVELPPSLRDFRDRMANQDEALSDEDLRDLATMKFRGAQPQTANDWHQLYLLLVNSARRRRT